MLFPDGPPNLDDFSIDPADHDAASEAMRLYAQILNLKATAMRHRLSGRISDAEKAEYQIEKHIRMLPEWARW